MVWVSNDRAPRTLKGRLDCICVKSGGYEGNATQLDVSSRKKNGSSIRAKIDRHTQYTTTNLI